MITQVVCLVLGAALACLWSGVQALRGVPPATDRRAEPLSPWESLMLFTAANMAALAGGVDPAGDWSLAAPLWVAAALMHGLFAFSGIVPLIVTTTLASLAMSAWIFFLAIQAA